ncbi:MAG: hypothetical protein HQ521_17415 [Bacteroidetes bacterium]|nr:hypothetical protein [Bacteroidota bacterium]
MKNAITVFTLFLSISVISQNKNTIVFQQLVNKTELSYKNKDKGKGSGYKQFKRWEDFVEKRLDENGNIVNNTAMSFTAYKNMKKKGMVQNTRSNGYWTELGPETWTNNPDPYPSSQQGGWNPGNGRINEIAFPATNSDIIYAGASGGGLWKTSDGGSSWLPLTDAMPNLAISGIAISHTNPDDIYILSGDGDSRDLTSIGVLKSTDGGSSWSQTFLTFSANQIHYGYELKMDPDSSSNLIAVTTNGLWKTNNGADSWSKKSDFTFNDIVYNESNADTIYASGKTEVVRSADRGNTWVQVLDLSGIAQGNSRIELAVTNYNSDKVYAVLGDTAGYRGLWISSDRGQNWVRHFDADGPNILGYDLLGNDEKSQATYDLAITVSPYDENQIFVGGINIWRSDDGGDNWSINSFWRQDLESYEYVHADIHELIFRGSMLYAGCDGGIFYTSTIGNNWLDLSGGLKIMQPHKIAISNSNTDLVYLGTQDNGCNKYTGTTTVENVRGADGFECLILPTNNNIVFTSSQNGSVSKSVDGGTTFSNIIAGNSETKRFNCPLILRSLSQNRLILPKNKDVDVYNLDGVLLNTKTIPQVGGSGILNLNMSTSNDNIMMASILGSTDDGSSDSVWITNNFFAATPIWTNITSNLPTQRAIISAVLADPSNSDHLIVSFRLYVAGSKVFESWNGGNSWINISYNLENVPINCIAIDTEIDSSFYIGTDVGVLYKDAGATSWTYYGNGMPSVIVNELEINTTDNLIYAATYGRGLWKSALYTVCPNYYSLTPENDPSNPNYTGVQHYEASGFILSTRSIVGGHGTDVVYEAGEYIDLKAGFVVKQGNKFEALTDGCGQ